MLRHCPSWGICPEHSSNGAYPVVALTLLLSANSEVGQHSSQSFWSLRMRVHNTCVIEQVALSVAPSVCGWNAVDIRSFVPNSRCSSFQNLEVNFVSRSDMMDLGTPWSRTISFRNSQATSLAVTHVVVSIRCTSEVKWLITTNK